jgi:ABC-type multidrug transport system ATPase subunit
VATSPTILIIDEPTTGLDADTAHQVLKVIRTRLPSTTLVLAMHHYPSTAPLGPTVTIALDKEPSRQHLIGAG